MTDELLNWEVADMNVTINPKTGSVAIMTGIDKDDIVLPSDSFLRIAIAHPDIKALIEAAKELRTCVSDACVCSKEYTSRGLIDPQCSYHDDKDDIERFDAALAKLEPPHAAE